MKISKITIKPVKQNLNKLFSLSVLNVDCGEVSGGETITAACLLGSVNLTQYVNLDRTFNWENYKEDVEIFTRMLDNVCELQNNDLPPYLWFIKNVRQFGMGITGFGSALLMMGIGYNTKEALEFSNQINKTKMNICLQSSAKLAKEKGKAPMFKENYFETPYWKEFLKGKLEPETIQLVKENGLRNLKFGANAPTGNMAIYCDNVSNGLEPVFMFSYERTYIVNWPEGLTLDNIKQILKPIKVADVTCWKGAFNGKDYYYEPHNRGLCAIEKVYDYGYKWVEENYPNDIIENKNYLVSSDKLKVEDHLNIQESFQNYLDQSVSKTVSLPNNYSFENFKGLYMEGWKRGLIGLTTYREGSMESVLSKITEEEERHIIKKDVKLPDEFVNGPTKVIKRENTKFYIHFSYLKEDVHHNYPVAIWITTNHHYSGEAIYVNRALRSVYELLLKYEVPKESVEAQFEKIKNNMPNSKLAKSISMCLRHNLPIESIVAALENLEGDNVSSLLTAIRKFLSYHIKDGTKAINKKCLNCGSFNVSYEAACVKCMDCGHGDCG